uniref:Nebulette n=1 Tax=Callorhinchus milii TaxID=7868 RepID=A0A4W3GUW2_CALMI
GGGRGARAPTPSLPVLVHALPRGVGGGAENLRSPRVHSAQPQTHTHTTQTHTAPHTDTAIDTHRHTHHTAPQTHTDIHSPTDTAIDTAPHTDTDIHTTQTHTPHRHTQPHRHTAPHTDTDIHTTQTHTQTHTHTHTTQTQTATQTHTATHTHTHTDTAPTHSPHTPHRHRQLHRHRLTDTDSHTHTHTTQTHSPTHAPHHTDTPQPPRCTAVALPDRCPAARDPLPRCEKMNPLCARCGKIVYPTEKVNCLDKYWHKSCFHCEICRMTLNMKTYKGYEKKPYCNAHYPKQSFTIVADTPENIRLKQQSELQSQVKYKENFEKSRKLGFSIVTDTPEMQRLKRTQEQISNCLTPRAIAIAFSQEHYKEHHVRRRT